MFYLVTQCNMNCLKECIKHIRNVIVFKQLQNINYLHLLPQQNEILSATNHFYYDKELGDLSENRYKKNTILSCNGQFIFTKRKQRVPSGIV